MSDKFVMPTETKVRAARVRSKEKAPSYSTKIWKIFGRFADEGVISVSEKEKSLLYGTSSFVSRMEPLWKDDLGWCRYSGILIRVA